jgi:RNA polymerase sigma-70 factor (ECF subfamily)
MTEPAPAPAPPSRADIFATTRWTLVVSAGRGTAGEAGRALEELCRTYWYPLYAYARRRGHAAADAEDLTQGFFARFLARNYLGGLDAEKGRFRAFLLASFQHFLANEADKAAALKRGGAAKRVPLDADDAESRYAREAADPLSPDRLYDRAWALELLARVLARLREEQAEGGRADHFEVLKGFLTAEDANRPYAEVADRLGAPEGAVRVAVHRLRRRYRALLRQEIADTLTRPDLVEDELRALMEAFS